MFKNGFILLFCGLLLILSAKAEAEDMALIPAGECTMGLSEAKLKEVVGTLGGMKKYHDSATPAHKVNLDAFYIDKYEVTNEEYKKFVDATGAAVPLHWEEEGG